MATTGAAKARGKIKAVMAEWKAGTLNSGSPRGPKVTNQKQAVAIALNAARKVAPKAVPKPPMFVQPTALAKGGTVTVGKGGATRKTGTYRGKSNRLGGGGRAAQLRARGVPEGVIGAIARSKQAAPGQKHYRGK